jgi:protease IV
MLLSARMPASKFSFVRALGLTALSLVLMHCRPRAQQVASGSGYLAVLDLRGAVKDSEGGSFLTPSKGLLLSEILADLQTIETAAPAKGVLVRLGPSLGLERSLEVGQALGLIRAKNKPVRCHADGLSNATLALAAMGCSSITVSPAGDVEAVGIATEIVYFRKLLADELHLSIDILQVGKYKGAEEPATRDGPSPEARASLEKVLSDLRVEWRKATEQGRGKPNLPMELGPYSPQEAKAQGLIDAVGYFDDVRAAFEKDLGSAERKTVGAAEAGVGQAIRSFAGGADYGALALVSMSGSISMGGTGARARSPALGLFGGDGGITEAAYGPLLDKLTQDDRVKAVVFRIDSPGGSALASDLLWHKLIQLRAKKLVIVSVGDMAASGGYYLASASNRIFAGPTSIVGSIGVVGGKIGIANALERFGVHAETFSGQPGDKAATARAAQASMFTPWDTETRARMLSTMAQVYELFLDRLVEGRKLDRSVLAASAEGRIFSGTEGKARQLVDELGGLREALQYAIQTAKLAPDTQAQMVQPARPLPFIGSLGGDEERASNPGVEQPVLTKPLLGAISPWASAFLPLLDGERTLCAVPFGIEVK